METVRKAASPEYLKIVVGLRCSLNQEFCRAGTKFDFGLLSGFKAALGMHAEEIVLEAIVASLH